MRFLAPVFVLCAWPAVAHELWIEPQTFVIEPDTMIVADLVNGENFEGTKLAFIPQRFEHFAIVSGGKFAPVESRIGSTPALAQPGIGTGLHVALYQSKPADLIYTEWEKFQRFLDHKDLDDDTRARHAALGATEDSFKEVYTRYSKTLVAVGDGAGADRRFGMETEIVALTNPYTDTVADGMRLQLFYQAAVRADEQIEIFERAPDGTVAVFLVRTDAEGVATVPVKPGHAYMADAVVLREPAPALAEARDAVWETLWANLTWAMPD